MSTRLDREIARLHAETPTRIQEDEQSVLFFIIGAFVGSAVCISYILL